jgi:hypothetical protein
MLRIKRKRTRPIDYRELRRIQLSYVAERVAELELAHGIEPLQEARKALASGDPGAVAEAVRAAGFKI